MKQGSNLVSDAPRIALRRAEDERADTLFRLRARTK